MKNISRKIFLGSLTSLTVMASTVASAEEMVTAPTFDGGVTASIGTFYAVPSADNNEYLFVGDPDDDNQFNLLSADADYDFGIEASLGYIFEDTANGIELSYRGFDTDDTTDPQSGALEFANEGLNLSNVQDHISYELNALDLMIGQFMDIGTHMQMRFSGGLSYVELEEEQHVTGTGEGGRLGEVTDFSGKTKSEFQGLGPRLAIDARYDFGEDLQGFGIVGGASAAYFLGETDLTAHAVTTRADVLDNEEFSASEDLDNHNVTNLRANLGIDYVYFFDNEELSTLGLELGYMVDWYDDAISHLSASTSGAAASSTQQFEKVRGSVHTTSNPLTFSGPYLNLKGAF